ncbi:MAG: hypothetical protein WBX26_11565, partial [Candidatus Cybelea sp.]
MACRVFQSRWPRMQLFKAVERGVEVCLIDGFASAQQAAFNGENADRPPLSVEALLRGPLQG